MNNFERNLLLNLGCFSSGIILMPNNCLFFYWHLLCNTKSLLIYYMKSNYITQKKYFIGLILMFLTFCSCLVQAQSIGNRDLRFRAKGFVDLEVSIVYYADAKYSSTPRNIGVRIKNIGNLPTSGVLSFTFKALPVNAELADMQILNTATITVDGNTYTIDNANWNGVFFGGGNNSQINFTSTPTKVIQPHQEIIIGLNIATHQNNFGDDVLFNGNIPIGTGGETNGNNNIANLDITYQF